MRAVVCHQAESHRRGPARPDARAGAGSSSRSSGAGSAGPTCTPARTATRPPPTSPVLGYDHFMRSTDHVVMGHEFVGTVLDHGAGTSRKAFPAGSRVVSLPVLRSGESVHLTGLSEQAPGGYAEQVLVTASMTMRVPDELDADAAALTEPMAVALHAVRRGQVGARDVAVVIGCGPIGLAVIAMLKATGVRHVIASDFSPGRRALAEQMGADVVVDPATDSPWASFAESKRYLTEAIALAEPGSRRHGQSLRAVPMLPWAHVMRAAEKVGATPRGPIVFECVGVPGMIEHVVANAPLLTRVVVVGVCMGQDSFRPSMAINKEIDLRFAFAYDPSEFHQTLQWIAAGKVDVRPLITGTVGLDGVAGAFADLADPERHAKILVDPTR
ncbi:zinc-binding dehydrogenase [Nocardioides convexus]|uniref:zinc-binding dehydrogenase n=1 Tax=Nocardioides convexus TaxID=2712224 RepID=UPI0024184E81|nr:zinc-binding dehydrogenase [Nocardioides convexus]